MNLQKALRPCLSSRINLQSKGLVCKRLVQNNQYTIQQRSFQTQTRIFHKHPSSVALVSLGLIFLGVGFYHHFSDIQKYPPSIRRSLRKALYYQQDKDLNLAIKYFNEALAEALQSSEMEKNGAPLTGIMIQLGTLQERMGRLPDARRTLTLALRHLLGLENDGVKASSDEAIFQTELSALPALEQKKAVGIAQKLGDITAALKMDKDAEKWYEWSVEHLLSVSSKPVSEYGDTDHAIFDEKHMPYWLTKTDVGAALEAFGAFYASRNKPNLAVHLYMRALTLNGTRSCQAAVLMNNLANSYSDMGQYEEAKIWGQKGLDLAQNPNTGKVNKDSELCDQTCGVLLFNMGMLFEQTDEKSKAVQFYQSARKHGHDYKQSDCIKEANHALKRVGSEPKTKNT